MATKAKEEPKKKEESKKKEEPKAQEQVAETQYLKGRINANEKAAPKLNEYDNGTLRLSGNFVEKTQEGTKTVNFVAYNKDAEKIHTALTQEDRNFTLAGKVKDGNLYVENVYKHKMMSIEGKINHVEAKGKTTRLLIGVPSDKVGNQSFAVNVHENKELNGAKLEKGGTIAVNGEGKIYDSIKEPNKRGVDITAWNVAPDKAQLEAIVAEKQAGKKETVEQAQTV